MKQDISVTAYSALTAYDKKDQLMSTIKLRVPNEDVDFLGQAHEAQEDDNHIVSFALVIRSKKDGEPRKLILTSKGSEMPRFIPLHVFTKYGNYHDNLTQLFNSGFYGDYELTLMVSVEDLRVEKEKPLDFEAQPEPVEHLFDLDAAMFGMVAEGCPHCPDAPDRDLIEAEHYLSTLSYSVTCELLSECGFDPSDWDDPKQSAAQDLVEMHAQLLHCSLPEVLKEARQAREAAR